MSVDPPTATELAAELTRAVVEGRENEWPRLARHLEALSGRDWLALDTAARSSRVTYMPVSPARGRPRPNLGEPTGLVAGVMSMHADGRIREAATRALVGSSGEIAVGAAAVRLLDHVEQVRSAAAASLLALLGAQPSSHLLVKAHDVVLAGRDRTHGAGALATLEEVGRRLFSQSDFVTLLVEASARRVRRHGFTRANDLGLLSVPRLLEAVRVETDQLVVAWCTDWLFERAAPSDFASLLEARSALARQVAVLRIDDSSLSDGGLLQLTADRAPRVREAARFRAGRRGLDVAAWYRGQLGHAQPAKREAAVLDGLLDVGDASDLPAFRAAMSDRRPRIRAVGLRGLAAWSAPGETFEIGAPMLLDPSARVCAAAARVLARAGAPASLGDTAWASERPGARRAAWFLARSRGGWDAVESDLRLAADADPGLADLGRTQLGNWLETRAATSWQPLPDTQRARIAALLEAWDGSVDLKRLVAFHAGIRPLPEKTAPPAPGDNVALSRRAWWRR